MDFKNINTVQKKEQEQEQIENDNIIKEFYIIKN